MAKSKAAATKQSKKFTFESKLESISDELEYYALPVPEKITKEVGTKAAVPVLAQVNGSKSFMGSLYPIGGGRHYMRVKAEVRAQAKIKEGDRARVQFTVRDRQAEVGLPKDVKDALRAEGVLDTFESMPLGQRSFLLRAIEKAAKPETRKKRIQETVDEAHVRREKKIDKRK